jgi:hypothetical protein
MICKSSHWVGVGGLEVHCCHMTGEGEGNEITRNVGYVSHLEVYLQSHMHNVGYVLHLEEYLQSHNPSIMIMMTFMGNTVLFRLYISD